MNELKGTPASTGKVEGTAYVISDPGQIVMPKENSILIISYTTPLMTLAIENSLAIVTEAGGLTSHAAIVSREFGKPCIVGVKDVTKIIKDGQKIKIDGDKGVIYYD